MDKQRPRTPDKPSKLTLQLLEMVQNGITVNINRKAWLILDHVKVIDPASRLAAALIVANPRQYPNGERAAQLFDSMIDRVKNIITRKTSEYRQRQRRSSR